MSSQFDALLDFGDDPPATTNGPDQKANGTDDFDPFGPGPLDSGKGGSGDGGLLLDFSVSTDTKVVTENGTASDPFDSQFTITADSDFVNTTTTSNSNSSNPFADMSATETTPSANPLYDLMDDDSFMQTETKEPSPSSNPLYDLSATDNNTNDFTFETTVTTTSTTEEANPSANPLYDFMDSEGGDASVELSTTNDSTQPASSIDDFLSGIDLGGTRKVMEKSTPAEDIIVEDNDRFVPEFGGPSEPFVPEFGSSNEPFVPEFGESKPAPVEDQIVPEAAAPEPEAGPRETTPESDEPAENFDQNVELFIREDEDEQQVAADVSDGLDTQLDVGEPQQQQEEEEREEEQQEEERKEEAPQAIRRSRSRSPSPHSISSEGEVINEEEELRKDGVSQYKNKEERSFNETRYDGQPATQFSDAGFGGQNYGAENGNVTTQKEDFHFQEMSAVKNQFEQGPQQPSQTAKQPIDIRQEAMASEGGVYESQPTTFQPQWEDEPEEGVYENQPQQRSDVVRESDRDIGAELPSVGAAKSIRDKFMTGQVENRSPQVKREVTPPAVAQGGVFENEPAYNPDVVHHGEDGQNEILPEQGTARNLAARFKELEKQGSVPVPSPGKRALTPDRTGKVEYVSEPRGHVERYEPQVQAGVFESQPAYRDDVVRSDQLSEEILPERGAAKNIANRFKQMSTENAASTPRGKRELTPDTSGRVEYVSEPTGYVEKYEGRAESGVFESQPADRADVVKSDMYQDEILPERGMARNIAARFKEMEKTTKSPPSPSKYKEFTPPRENGISPRSAGVFENQPQPAADVVSSGEQVEEILPERGMAKNIANRFRQMGSTDNTPKSPRAKKEFTPPPNAGVFENTPQQFIPDYNRPAESGILESKPEIRNDVVRGDEPPKYEQELPERGYTRNLVSAWKQRESESAKISPTGSGKVKEFTPPREEPRVAQQRPAPRTPKSPQAGGSEGSVHPMDLPGQYQPQAEPTVFESEPDRRDDVVREDDTDWNAGMPKENTTKKMLAKFKHIQDQASSKDSAAQPSPRPTPVARKGSEDRSSNGSASEQAQNIRN